MHSVSFEKWADLLTRIPSLQFPLREALARCERVKCNSAFADFRLNVAATRNLGSYNEQTHAYDYVRPEMEPLPIQDVCIPRHRKNLVEQSMYPGGLFELIAFAESVTLPVGTIVVSVWGKDEEVGCQTHFYCITSTENGWELGQTYWYVRNWRIFDQFHILGCKAPVVVS